MQSNSNNAEKNSYLGIPSNIEKEEVGDINKACHESNSISTPKELERSCNNADINPITNTNIGDKSTEGHESNNSSSKAAYESINNPNIDDAKGNSDNINTTGRWSPASSEGDDPDAVSSNYMGPVISIFGHLKGKRKENKSRASMFEQLLVL